MKRKFFLRRALRYFMLMLFPALVLYLGAAVLTGSSAKQRLEEQGAQLVSSAETNLQLVFSGVQAQTEYFTTASRMATALRRILNKEALTYGDAIYMGTLQGVLKSMTQAYPYIESVYLYLDNYTRMFTSTQGIVELAGADHDVWLEAYQQMEPDRDQRVIARTLTRTGYGVTDVLTVYQRQLLQKGCVVINLDAAALERMLDTFITGTQAQIFLLDKTGTVLAQTEHASHESDAFDVQGAWNTLTANGLTQTEAAAQTGTWVKQRGRSYLLSTQSTVMADTYLVSVIPDSMLYTAIFERLGSFGILLMLILAIVMLLAYTTTKQSFAHINAIMEMLEDAERGKEVQRPNQTVHDEYDVIMNNLVYLFLNTTYLNIQLKEKQYRQENAELMALQLQINPHFLFNTLQTLDMEAQATQKNGRMHAIIGYVSHILKYALDDPQQPVTLEQEITYLKEYAEVQRYRFGDRFIVYYDIDEQVRGAAVFRLMLQPMLENSLLHGIRSLQGKGYIKVRLRKHKTADSLRVSVTDNGIGMTKEQLQALRHRVESKEGRSIGLTNLNRRLILRYGAQSALKIYTHHGKGTRVQFDIPFVRL